MLRIPKRGLVLTAGIVWLAAGVNILRIGIMSAIGVWGQGERWRDILLPIFALLILIGFSLMLYRIVTRHVTRIMGYRDEKVSIFRFFDLKGYLMMAFMMALGILLRSGDFLPDYFFAFFYTGLGSALSLAGLRFGVRFFRLTLRQIFLITIGLLSVALGTLGIFLPILPTVPLYLLAGASFLSSSEGLYRRFQKSRLYRRYLQPYLDRGGLTRRAKLCLILFVTLQIVIAAVLVRKSMVGLIVLGVLYLGFLISMLLVVKTMSLTEDREENKEDSTCT